MVIIRESPSPRKPPSKAAWPPRSPHDALLASPSRQKRARQYRDTSPSPVKRRRISQDFRDDTLGSDDDEETLQLKLQQIAAKLKLKKLQNAKRDGPSKERDEGPTSTVEVPHSPKIQRTVEQPLQSPKRVQLGIDRGLRAANVSLKRARPPQNSHTNVRSAVPHKSFGARLLDDRSNERAREAKRAKHEERRSHGFAIKSDGSNSRKEALTTVVSGQRDIARPTSDVRSQRPASSIAQQNSKSRKTTSPNAEVTDRTASEDFDPHSGFDLCTRHMSHAQFKETLEDKTLLSIPSLLKQVVAPDYDPPDIDTDFVVFGIIASKSTPYNHTPKHTTDPDTAPDRSKFMVLKLTDLKWELDLFLFDTAFTRFWKLTPGTVIAVLNPGIMPPKPHMRDTGQFSLKLASSEETVLEIGTAADLGWCKSVKKDGKVCGAWINSSKTEFCDFHVNLGVERARAGRMEVNGMVGMGLFAGERGGNRGAARGRDGRGGRGGKSRDGGLLPEGPQYNRATGETAYVIPKEYGSGGNTARMLDSEDYVHGGLSKAERSQKRLAEFEKEQKLSKALALEGSGLGGEYARRKRPTDAEGDDYEDGRGASEKPKSAAELGLLGAGAEKVRLSPSKRRPGARKDGAKAEPMGWSGAHRRGLLSPSRKENQSSAEAATVVKSNEVSPRKKARFLLEKGVRVPGRDSLPAAKRGSAVLEDDDDDLDIV